MFVRTLTILGICLFIYPLAGLSDPGTDRGGSASVETKLTEAVQAGATIDEAVADSVGQAPEQGVKITRSALRIYKTLPKTACATRAQDGGLRLQVWPDFKACGDRIVKAAIEAGADPTRVTSASAAGSPESGPERGNAGASAAHGSNRQVFGIDLYMVRKFLASLRY